MATGFDQSTCDDKLRRAGARWISRDSIVWDIDVDERARPCLYYCPAGEFFCENGELQPGVQGKVFELRFNGCVGEADSERDCKLAYLESLHGQPRIDTSELSPEKLLDGGLALGILDVDGKLLDVTGIQCAGILDELYAYKGELGPIFFGDTPLLRLWAPTAQQVKLHLYSASSEDATFEDNPIEMTKLMEGERWTGVWELKGRSEWKNVFYLYEVTVFAFWSSRIERYFVTDPYSVSLSANSKRSQIVDLHDPALFPEGWTTLEKPELGALEDTVLYELHLRDFSISDTSVDTGLRGKFTAFCKHNSNGMKHLQALSQAGLTHVHLLPASDIATINENFEQRVDMADRLSALCEANSRSIRELCEEQQKRTILQTLQKAVAADPASEVPSKITAVLKDLDGFNWGYDPFHYGVPEGSYATDPNGSRRILEFRQMVTALNAIGLRVVMDVVYNHTQSARDSEKSVLDKIVPGYYYRLDKHGNVQNTTCCPDTATEHRMMEKLMLDTLKRWAVEYKVDGFRFDLMGHHTRQNMRHVRELFDSLTLERDGVDGAKIYVYGEGWEFGSIQDNLPSPKTLGNVEEQAAFTQKNAAGIGIGTFNDRIRDAMRGGNFHPSTKSDQGFVSGLYYDYNACPDNVETSENLEEQKRQLLNYTDTIRIGLAANLQDYELIGAEGQLLKGGDVNYRGMPAGYTAAPKECVNFVSAHDNYTLWDQLCAKAPFETAGREPATATIEERVRMQRLALSLIALGQGIPFFHAGSEILRSKSGDYDSYNSGDWFNRLDFSYECNGWGLGLPPEEKNREEWEFWKARLRSPELRPSKDLILENFGYFQALLRVRKSSRLFRLQTAEEVKKASCFLNAECGAEQLPGLIVMRLTNPAGRVFDPERKSIIVTFNATTQTIHFSHEILKNVDLKLHPNFDASVDIRLEEAEINSDSGTIIVPPRSTLICVEPQNEELQE